MLNYLRYLLWPFSVLYGVVIAIRNKAYDWQLLKSVKFDLPVIVVGNLAIGGAGKSPMTEYLIALLSNTYKVAVLSRGYGRNTNGYFLVEQGDDAEEVGDEPLQFKNKFPKITVAVCESRVEGIRKLKDEHEIIILDDAFQHRALTPGFSVLLFDYESLFSPKILLPAGNFRDAFRERRRADVIIVSKSPPHLTDNQKAQTLQRLAAFSHQKVFFSFLKYGNAYSLSPTQKEPVLNQGMTVLLVTGIANPSPLVQYLQEKVGKVVLLDYPDHHYYTKQDMTKISTMFHSIKNTEKLMITTEKDAQRFKRDSIKQFTKAFPFVIIPIEAAFGELEEDTFSSVILDYCAESLC